MPRTTRRAAATEEGQTPVPHSMIAMISDPEAPFDLRVALLSQLLQAEGDEARTAVQQLLDATGARHDEHRWRERAEELGKILAQLREGPLRPAVFLDRLRGEGIEDRARVQLHDGTLALCAVPDRKLLAELGYGEHVYLDAQARALLGKEPCGPEAGEVARLEHWVDERRIEVSLAHEERAVFHASARLLEQARAGEAEAGCSLLVWPQARLGLAALPARDGLAHLRYLAREAVPDVVIERDLGRPPQFLASFAEHLLRELDDPEMGRRYRLPRLRTLLLTGVTGSGKTLAIAAWWRRMYELCAERLGVAVEDLPYRVVRLESGKVLSHWFGMSESNIDRLFDEVTELCRTRWKGPDGRLHELPVLLVIEECDGLSRTRGEEPIGDRVLTTLLRRLDARGNQALRDGLLFVVATTNTSHLVDPAFLRRIGGRIELFGRLDRGAFREVLDKHLDGRPLRANGHDGPRVLRRMASDLEAWLYAPREADEPLVELTYVGTATPERRHRRDFLSGALIDRAVQQAAEEACARERAGGQPGLDVRELRSAFEAQVQALVDQLRPENAHEHLTLREGARVGTLRRLPRPKLGLTDLAREP